LKSLHRQDESKQSLDIQYQAKTGIEPFLPLLHQIYRVLHQFHTFMINLISRDISKLTPTGPEGEFFLYLLIHRNRKQLQLRSYNLGNNFA
jgi:hypothetical protein